MASSSSGGVSVPALWSEVNRYGQNGDFTRALKTVNKSEYQGGYWGPAGPANGPSPYAARVTASGSTWGGKIRAPAPSCERLESVVGVGRSPLPPQASSAPWVV